MGCNARDCKKPKDQQRIDKSKKMFNDKKEKGGVKPKSKNGRRQTNDKRKWDKGGDQYCRKVWNKSNLAMANGALHVNCRTCGMKTTYSIKYHRE